MRAVKLLAVAIVIGSLAIAGAVVYASRGTPEARTIDPDGAAALAGEAVEDFYGDSTPYAGSAEPVCPRGVPVEKGVTFRCEVLYGGELVPVKMRVVTPLGFLDVAAIDGIRHG